MLARASTDTNPEMKQKVANFLIEKNLSATSQLSAKC